MERSQDEIMNSNDSARESQGKVAYNTTCHITEGMLPQARHIPTVMVIQLNILSCYVHPLYFNFKNNTRCSMGLKILIFWDNQLLSKFKTNIPNNVSQKFIVLARQGTDEMRNVFP